jgi:hypothetical protein
MPARTAIAANIVSLFAGSFIVPSLRAFFEAVHNRPDFIPIAILPTIGNTVSGEKGRRRQKSAAKLIASNKAGFTLEGETS